VNSVLYSDRYIKFTPLFIQHTHKSTCVKFTLWLKQRRKLVKSVQMWQRRH